MKQEILILGVLLGLVLMGCDEQGNGDPNGDPIIPGNCYSNTNSYEGVTAYVKICGSYLFYPAHETDYIQFNCFPEDAKLFVNVDADMCSENGCPGLEVADSYKYYLGSKPSTVKAVCWIKVMGDEWVDDDGYIREPYWSWASQGIIYDDIKYGDPAECVMGDDCQNPYGSAQQYCPTGMIGSWECYNGICVINCNSATGSLMQVSPVSRHEIKPSNGGSGGN